MLDEVIGAADHPRVRPLPHGYTNRTVGGAGRVVKTYQGPDSAARSARERDMLVALAPYLPVPAVLDIGPDSLTLEYLPGVHGQDLIKQGHAAEVLQACGRLLRQLQQTPVNAVVPDHAASPDHVIVHGDFGPNNVLLDPGTFTVTALLDWEFSHVGTAVEDLAWCEWIVRAHHPDHRAALAALHADYALPVPPWPIRQAAMLTRCRHLRAFCHRWQPDGPGVRQWEDRAAMTAGWIE